MKHSTRTKIPIALICFWVSAGFFAILAGRVTQGPLALDSVILRGLYSWSSPALDGFVVRATDAGGVMAASVVALVLAAWLWWRARPWQAGFILLAVGGASVTSLILKLCFQRSRPDLWQTLITENSYSFPSSHAMASSALAFGLMVLAWHTQWRWPVMVGAGAYILLVGLSRMYLGVHYPTDVVAGWCISLAWITLVYAAMKRYAKQRPSTSKRDEV